MPQSASRSFPPDAQIEANRLDFARVFASSSLNGAVPFEMMLYPGYTHRVGGQKVGVQLWETIFAFLSRAMPPEKRE